jgi:hypothetical protein
VSGSKPGERRGGRKPNTPNKLSTARVAEARAQGKKLPPENLLLIAENSMAMAARYEPGTKEKPNENYDEERYAFWLSAAREANKAAAPYYAPRLHAIAVQTVPSILTATRSSPPWARWLPYQSSAARSCSCPRSF